jgi:abortive infection Abi-like protein
MEEYVGLEIWLKQNDPVLHSELYGGDLVPLEHLEDASKILDVAEISRHAARIRRSITEDPSQAIGSAKELVETVLKTVVEDYSQKSLDDIPRLLKKAQEKLGLDPKSVGNEVPGAQTLRRTLSNLGQVVVGVAEIRSLYGTGHGRSKSRELEIAHARLVVNAAVSIATFFAEVWKDRTTTQI